MSVKPIDERLVVRHALDRLTDDALDVLHHLVGFIVCDVVGQGIVAAGDHPLTDQHLHPAVLVEQVVLLPEHAAVALPPMQLALQAVGDVHLPEHPPELGVLPRVRVVVQDQEVADLLELQGGLLVVLLRIGGVRSRGSGTGGSAGGGRSG